jgi:hypothetical protein
MLELRLHYRTVGNPFGEPVLILQWPKSKYYRYIISLVG